MEKVVDYIHVQLDRYVEELKQYLAIPSVSATIVEVRIVVMADNSSLSLRNLGNK